MAENTNKAIRLRTVVNPNAEQGDNYVSIHLDQDYDTFEILSMKLNDTDAYKLHNSTYGVIAGRVIANGGFGVPNAKISVFIEADNENDSYEVISLYSYKSTVDKNSDDYKYNLLTDKPANDCHQAVGSFPNKTYMLDNDVLLEVFDKYYKYTCRTNNSGDYMICGVPTGNQTLHMDLDISDCGILSQRPRDFVYKGYTIEQFENPNQFRKGKDFNGLSQIFSQDKIVYVQPFWGNDAQGETIGITRADIEVNFKFEPTCVFLGCAVSDAASNGISKKCIPTENMGLMEELTTGEGKIEMIRKTPAGNVEEFQIKGTALIDSNGVWCYQIPMNLDYMVTDEFGNMVPTDDPEKGIPTRTRVRFRISLNDFEENANVNNFFRGKVLIPHNPQDHYDGTNTEHDEYDYSFGSTTKEESFRDLFWNNVYSVKSYIPRFQKTSLWRSKKFSGIKGCNHSGTNNPIPYNNIRIRLSFMFVIMCALIKAYIRIVSFINFLYLIFYKLECYLANLGVLFNAHQRRAGSVAKTLTYVTIADGLCPDLETWYFAPKVGKDSDYCYAKRLDFYGDDGDPFGMGHESSICEQTIRSVAEYPSTPDEESIDKMNTNSASTTESSYCLTKNVDYLIVCIEMNLAQEYKIINFDFYNDWINGMVYIPRWVRESRRKSKRIRGKKVYYDKIKGCMADASIFGSTRYYTQQCALSFSKAGKRYTKLNTQNGCTKLTSFQNCHKTSGLKRKGIFSNRGGIVQEETTMRGQHVYYCKPCEWNQAGRRILLYANDLILLGSLNDCSLYGIPQAFKWLSSSSYIMPTNLALTNMDTDSYVYGKSDGTYCTTTLEQALAEKSLLNEFKQKVTQTGNNFSEVGKYYSTLKNDQEAGYVGYGKSGMTENPSVDDGTIKVYYDDLIAVTEAAGISWNYTGPGQGTPNERALYYPGGHFLGLSCTNSQTNVKSCVNLQRICEMGANMSQRRQVTRRLDNNGNYYYTYFSPTGLISTDDISSVEFRSMFATMNMKPLIADKLDKNTGYNTYSFIYMRPNGFNGALKGRLGNTDYNKKIEGLDVDLGYLKELGISENSAFDIEEVGNTYNRTNEVVKNDYYDFRMGITPEMLLMDFDNIQKRKFGDVYTNETVVLPQYENSFYFYFGLKDGSTAFDKFLSDFYSTCTAETIKGEPRLYVSIENNVCDGSSLSIAVENLDYENGLTYKLVLMSNNKVLASGDTDNYVITITGIKEYGQAILSVTDSNGVTAKVNVILGSGLINAETKRTDFKVNILDNSELKSKNGTGELSKAFYDYFTGGTDNGGYITVNFPITISTNNNTKQYIIEESLTDEATLTDNAIILIVNKSGLDNITTYDIVGNPTSEATDAIQAFVSENYGGNQATLDPRVSYFISSSKDFANIFVWGVEEEYDIYFGVNCSDTYSFVKISSYLFNGLENFDLVMGSLGSKGLRYSKRNPDGVRLSDLNGRWWENLSANLIDSARSGGNTTNNTEITEWLIKKCIVNEGYIPLILNEHYYSGTIGLHNGHTEIDVKYDEENGSYSSSNVRCYDYAGYADSVLYGTPENINGTKTDISIRSGSLSSNLYNAEWGYQYGGYDLDDNNFYWPTYVTSGMSWDSYLYPYSAFTWPTKYEYHKMGYSSNGDVIGDPLNGISALTVSFNEGVYCIELNGFINSKMYSGNSILINFEHAEDDDINTKLISGIIVKDEPVGSIEKYTILTKDDLTYYDTNGNITTYTKDDLKEVYATFTYPHIYRPFYVTYNSVLYTTNSGLQKQLVLDIHNGLTFNNFYTKISVSGLTWTLIDCASSYSATSNPTEWTTTKIVENRWYSGYDNVTYLLKMTDAIRQESELYKYEVIEGRPSTISTTSSVYDFNEAWQQKIPDFDTNNLWSAETRNVDTTIQFFDTIYFVDVTSVNKANATNDEPYNEDGYGNSMTNVKVSRNIKGLVIHEQIELVINLDGETSDISSLGETMPYTLPMLEKLKQNEFKGTFWDNRFRRSKGKGSVDQSMMVYYSGNTFSNFIGDTTSSEIPNYTRMTKYIYFKDCDPNKTDTLFQSPDISNTSQYKDNYSFRIKDEALTQTTEDPAYWVYSEPTSAATSGDTFYSDNTWAVFANEGQDMPESDGSGVQYYFVKSSLYNSFRSEDVEEMADRVQDFINNGHNEYNGFIFDNPIKFSTLGSCVESYSINDLISNVFNVGNRNDKDQYSVDLSFVQEESDSTNIQSNIDTNRVQTIKNIKDYIDGIKTDYDIESKFVDDEDNESIRLYRKVTETAFAIIGFDKEKFSLGIRAIKVYGIKESVLNSQDNNIRNGYVSNYISIPKTPFNKNYALIRGGFSYDYSIRPQNNNQEMPYRYTFKYHFDNYRVKIALNEFKYGYILA